tara:strand:- start:1437 stop:3230 length:1794 start_codon:yes stop_codon:yes gene_type:complete
MANEGELETLRKLFLEFKSLPAGRTLWLGGTDVAKTRESSQFNCSGIKVETVHDLVDVMWLLLQGCGVGIIPVSGALNGFTSPIPELQVIRSTRTEKGREASVETVCDGVWTIQVGDSAEAWAKVIGKIVAGKYRVDKLVIDCSEIRPSGTRLKGYGWISSGDEALVNAIEAIFKIMNRKAGRLISNHDIHDIVNWLGTVLSSRRSAEIVLYDYKSPGWETFATFKKDFWLHGNEHRQQSNNSLLFWSKPTRNELRDIFALITASGGSEPGFFNAEAAIKRANYFSTVNPCGEILLGNKSFCNLMTVNLAAFKTDPYGLTQAIQLVARANYRQTCVDLHDGVLQSAWHENNDFLRLCGVGLSGIVMRPDLTEYDYRVLRNCATVGAYSMADDLHLPRPKNVTCIKPDGTHAKVYDATEGAHMPGGRYILNNIKLSSHDPLVPILRKAKYRVQNSPTTTDVDTVLATLPMEWKDVPFTLVDGIEVNVESAVDQLNRYLMLMENYVDNNCSLTVSYDVDEIPEIIDWLDRHWDSYVGVSWLYRIDPTKTAEDLGYPYLPQEVVSKEVFGKYVSKLKELDNIVGDELIDDDCSTGACPVR